MPNYIDLPNGYIKRTSDGIMFPKLAECLEYQEFLRWIDAGNTLLPYKPDPAEVLAAYTAAIQARLDAFAQTRGYDSGVSCASYAASTNATFKAEAGRFVELRDQTWAKCYAIMDDIKSGNRPMPTLDELLLELPVLTWDANV